MSLLFYPVHLFFEYKRKKSRKKPPYKGTHMIVPRGRKSGVDTYIYSPANKPERTVPVVFNVHGGAWLAGDSLSMDEQSQRLADRCGCFVVHIGYKLCDEKPFPYQQEEVADTVSYFFNHAADYNIDINRSTLIGYSAGAHICAGAAVLLRDRGVVLNSQFLCYPFLNFVGFRLQDYAPDNRLAPVIQHFMEKMFFSEINADNIITSPGNAKPADLENLAPCELIACGPDVLLPHAKQYYEKLKTAGVPCELRIYEKAEHGFLENQSPESGTVQAGYMNECETYIAERLNYHWNGANI